MNQDNTNSTHQNRAKERRQQQRQDEAEKRLQAELAVVTDTQPDDTDDLDPADILTPTAEKQPLPERQKQQIDKQPMFAGSSNSLATVVAVGAVTFAIGSAGAFGYAQWRSSEQQDAITQLALQLATMQQEGATRNATPDLTGVAGMAANTIAEQAAAEQAAAETDAVTDPDVVAVSAPISQTPAEPETSAATLVAAVSAAATPATTTPETPEETQEEKIAGVITGADRNQMRMLTEGVVAGLYTVTTEDVEGLGTRIALTTRNSANSAMRLERLLADAAAKGEIDVPDGLANDDGTLDARTMLFSVVQSALAQGTPDQVAAAQELGLAAFSASPAQTEQVGGQRYYVVARGDSLAYIALQFYGNSDEFWRIYEANTDTMRNVNTLEVGQRLRIPAI